mmetsp:Transcript_25131/g.74654  ORF Transcript_25131/g.74654 Transcript_25131/m.74654 type:complete len:218 (-) Transcript_25131:523-1176(-)
MRAGARAETEAAATAAPPKVRSPAHQSQPRPSQPEPPGGKRAAGARPLRRGSCSAEDGPPCWAAAPRLHRSAAPAAPAAASRRRTLGGAAPPQRRRTTTRGGRAGQEWRRRRRWRARSRSRRSGTASRPLRSRWSGMTAPKSRHRRGRCQRRAAPPPAGGKSCGRKRGVAQASRRGGRRPRPTRAPNRPRARTRSTCWPCGARLRPLTRWSRTGTRS